MSVFAHPFMQYALLGALITGLAAPALGTYLVQRRMALIGDGIGHVALTGVAVGLLTRGEPVLTAMLVAAAGAVAIEVVRARGRTTGDIALAVMFYGGIAGGVFLVNLSPSYTNANLIAYLFGSPLTTTTADLWLMAGLAGGILAVSLGLRPWLFAVCHDEEYARVSGLPVRALNLVLAVTTAVTVTVAMRAVGLLLVSALMVVPVATAQLLARGFRTTQQLAMGIGLVVSGAGIVVAGVFDTAPGATIVLLAIAAFVAASIAVAAWRRLRPRWAPGEAGVVVEPTEVVRE
ncbi:MAG TPA: metal ABC transporter permease [Natronosporangium sp.]|nr:metal ABC transporter permease [Natronosporangium sp.]